ncbi:LysM peptidoglycan-binding domain-containing protein [Streptomyces sp. NPDC057580]|uniref:LysM peptidoglycan-binding domain-containing protein n=1 Tax=Streptomyces sp. NPDC057580 TaxID=3346173 RepID=UPI0036C4331E
MVGLTLLFVASLLAGVLLAVHGPSQPSSGTSHSVTLQPDAPATPKTTTPDPTTPKSPQKKEAKLAAKRSTITLKPGDTLYQLARTHHTTVKTL